MKKTKETNAERAARCAARRDERRTWAERLGVPLRCLRWKNGKLCHKGSPVAIPGSRSLKKKAA